MQAIVYTSNTGKTAEYAKLLGERISLPVYSLKEASKKLQKGSEIIYLGWLFASNIKGFKKAAKRYSVSAVCGVGLGDTGSQIENVRSIAKVPAETPLFTLQGGMDKSKLTGINKFMIDMLTKGLLSKSNRTEEEEKMLALLEAGGHFVSEENLADVLAWYNERSN